MKHMKRKVFRTFLALTLTAGLTLPAGAYFTKFCPEQLANKWELYVNCQSWLDDFCQNLFPQKPCLPDAPVVPEAPEVPDTPVVPEKPDAPDAPVVPEKPEVPDAPVVPDKPEVPDAPVVPDKPEDNGTADTDVHSYEKAVADLVNAERAKYGLAPLTLSADLCAKARIKSIDMAENNYFSHNSPTYGSPFDMMKQFGITYRSAGENIAMGQRSPEAVMTAWMNSQGHRENILSEKFTAIGVGYVADGNYWTQWFIG